MHGRKILLVEDDPNVLELLRFNLAKEGFRVSYTSDGNLVLAEVRRFRPELIVLDLMLPGLPGLEVCRQLRASDIYCGIAILILSARTDEADRVLGLEMGADDYVTKPFSLAELIARIRALLRRHGSMAAEQSMVQCGHLSIDLRAHRVSIGSRTVDLSVLEFRRLHLLATNPGMVFSRARLLDQVWGTDRSVSPRAVDVCVRRLREKMGEESEASLLLETVHGIGYRFSDPESSPMETLEYSSRR
jgi:DNA-binding response OmpR family regulator